MNFERVKDLHDKNQSKVLPIKPWMSIEIQEKLEWENNRVWRFKCLVIRVKKPNHADGTFTVRWEVAGVEVEKIYPLSFPKFKKLTLLDDFKIRKSKLYYIRDKVWKSAKMKSKIAAKDREKDLLS